MSMSEQQALEKIVKLCAPGQQLDVHQCIDVICDVFNLAKDALNAPRNEMGTKT